jgi:GNAT superfamily N-acetyltransferase
MTVVVRRATVAEIMPLRRAVLRPGYPPEASHYAEDDVAVHVGGWDDDALIGCATVFADPWPGPPPAPDAWRLRGMAVDPTRQGTGLGAQVLAEAVAAARTAGAPLIWANARTTALGFYLRYGWQVAGEEFLASDTGLPHLPILLALGLSSWRLANPAVA